MGVTASQQGMAVGKNHRVAGKVLEQTRPAPKRHPHSHLFFATAELLWGQGKGGHLIFLGLFPQCHYKENTNTHF